MKATTFYAQFTAISLITLLLLGNAGGGSGCEGCTSSLSKTGSLPDTTLNTSNVWALHIQNELWQGMGECDGDYGDPFTPAISFHMDEPILELTQTEDSLHIRAIKPGTTRLTLITSIGDDRDPDIGSQHAFITVQ